MSNDNVVYSRGSKTARIKTARIPIGARLLTHLNADGGVRVAPKKTGAIVRVVEEIIPERTAATGFYRRAGRVYTVKFTDGTESRNNAPIQTWDALVLDESSSASRQHFIDVGYYLTENEVAVYATAN